MKKITTSLVAILISTGFAGIANAEIASKNYVDAQNTTQTTTLNTAIAAKADQATTYTKTEVDTSLGLKANTADLGTLASKNTVTTSDIDDASVTKPKLSLDVQTTLGKADTALQSADLAGYAQTATVNTALATKEDVANKSDNMTTDTGSTSKYTTVHAVETYVGAGLATKANTTDVNTALATKADQATTYTKTEVDTSLGLKANTADVNTALATKADQATTYTKTEVDTSLGLKANTADLGSLATAAPGACANPTNKCVLTFDGTAYSWEIVER